MSAVLAEVFPVGEVLSEELEARGWTQAEFADVLNRPAQFVSEIIAGRKEITRESASQIAAALGTSPEFWLSMQDKYHLWRQAQDERAQGQLGDVRLRARLKELAPIPILVKRGFIASTTPAEQASELQTLYGMSSLEDDPAILVAARRSKAAEQVSSTQVAWVACVRSVAAQRKSEKFNPTELSRLAGELTRIVKAPKDLAKLPALFAAVGVRLVFVEAFPGSKMDGCSFNLDGAPVIGISGRGRRLDKVLFTLLHEIAHVIRGDLDGENVIIDDAGGGPTLGDEEAADSLAATWALPKELPAIPERITQGWIMATAEDQGVHPIVLIGRLQRLRRIPWRTTLVRNAPSVLEELAAW